MKENRIAPLEALASYNSVSKARYVFMYALAYKFSFLDEGYGVEGNLVMETGWKPSVEISPYCPRCGSSNTKFCYYNNYSLTQPRYFCKGCKRYWTKGGSLRNVSVGGGCRKNRRGKSLIRLPTDAVIPSESLSCGAVSYYENEVNALPDQSNSSSAMSDGSHIDLALVFANYLNNEQPENKSGFEVSELPRGFGSSLELSNMEPSDIKLPEENGVVGYVTHSNFSMENQFRNNDHIYYSGHETSNYALAGDDISCQEIVWPDSLQATQEPNVMFGNWSPFDLSSDDTFTRT